MFKVRLTTAFVSPNQFISDWSLDLQFHFVFREKKKKKKLDEFCDGYPHNFTPTPGYWIECSRQSGRAGRRRNHGIQEEGSQEDSNSPSDEEDDDDDDEEEGEKEREENDNGTGIQTDSFDCASSGQLNQRHANGVASVFTSTDSIGAGPSDRSGRKVQLVHQHIQVPVDKKPSHDVF